MTRARRRLRVPLDEGSAPLTRIDERFRARLRAPLVPQAFVGVSKKAREAARRFWSQRAWSEYAALPALSRLLLLGVGERAPVTESSALAAILHDEALHTQLSKDAADALGGYVEDVPDDLAYDPYVYAAPSSMTLAEALVTGGCLGETISRALIQVRLPHTSHPALAAVVARTLKDESVHVAYAWGVAERVLPALPRAERRRIADLVAPALRGHDTGRASSALAQRQQERLRQAVADAGLGSVTVDDEQRAVRRVIETKISPGLRRLGIPV